MATNVSYNQPIYLHGVGKSLLVYSDGSVLKIDTAKDLQIQTSATEGKQEGGDSLYPLLTFTTAKSGKITITEASFSLQQAMFTQGGQLKQQAMVSHSEVVKPSTGSATLSITSNVDTEFPIVTDTVTGLPLKLVKSSPKAGEFSITSAGVISVDSKQVNPIEVVYYTNDTTGISLESLNDSISKPCQFRHTLVTDVMDDNNRYKVDIIVFRCKANSNFTYDAKRGEPFSPKLEFDILDSGRADKRTMVQSVSLYTE